MKILLVGEYSRLHNSLKEGLVALGHEVTLLGDGDNFKGFPVDLSIQSKLFNANWFLKKLKVGFFMLTKIDLQKWESAWRFKRHKKLLKGYDVVQFINSNALKTPLNLQKKQITFLKEHNQQLYLCACGTDTPIVDFLLKDKMRNHILSPYLNKEYPENKFNYELNYITKSYRKYYYFFEEQLDGMVASDMDYYLPLQNHPKMKGLIPNPINLEKLKVESVPVKKPIHIFLGINPLSQHKKGTIFFEKALEKINEKYSERIKITIAEGLPYQEYLKVYRSSHILLDMVYGYDQGYNALEAMAQGKVVFTGAELEFLDQYGLKKDEVCINALPDVGYLTEKLSWLIENPTKISKIGKNAQQFIKQQHHHKNVAKKYLEVWKR